MCLCVFCMCIYITLVLYNYVLCMYYMELPQSDICNYRKYIVILHTEQYGI